MGIFNLGNVNFKKEGDGFAAIDPKSQKYLKGTSLSVPNAMFLVNVYIFKHFLTYVT